MKVEKVGTADNTLNLKIKSSPFDATALKAYVLFLQLSDVTLQSYYNTKRS